MEQISSTYGFLRKTMKMVSTNSGTFEQIHKKHQ